jgi:TonB family protein
VQLFVREKDDKGDDQNRIDLSARDLASGSREYRPAGNDVTFRLEVVDRTGRVSAESFRLMRAVNPVPPPTAPAPRATQPKPIYKAPPVVAAGIRSRIKGTIPIDVRVQIDARGRVVSATLVTRQHSGLDRYLAGRAVQAARLWRFEPAREDGKAVAGSQVIHFVFDK